MAYCVAGNYTIQNCLGIGTETPVSPLEISYANTAYLTCPHLTINNSSLLGQTHIDFTITGSLFGKIRSDYEGNMIYVTNTRGTERAHQFFINGDSGVGTAAMVIRSNGNVGIGTSSPTVYGQGLEVAGGSQTGIRVSSTSGNKIEIGADSTWGYIQTTNTGQSVAIYAGAAQGPYMVINCAGNVGIGTTSPGSILHIKGPSLSGCPFGAELRVWENSFGAVVQGSTQGTTYAFFGNFRYNFTTPASSDAPYSLSAGGMLVKDGIHIFTSNPNASTFTPAERLTIDNSGNVGIGTTGPSSRLHVAGDVGIGTCVNSNTYAGPSQYGAITFPRAQLLFSNTNAQAQFYFISNGTLNASSQFTYTCNGRAGKINIDDGGIALDVASCGTNGCVISWTAGIQINNSGNVGIGTYTPSSRLHITHTGAQGACTIILQSTDSCGNGTISWRTSAGVTQAQIGSNYNVGDNGGNLELITSAATRLLVTSAGNVGIGTTSPSQRLHVTGRAIISNGTGTNESLSVGTTSSSTGTNFGTIDVNGLDYSAYYLRTNDTIRFGIFQTGGVTSVNTITNIPLTLGTCDTERMRITNGGNVGIGTTSPGGRLHVDAGAGVSTDLVIGNLGAGGSKSKIYFYGRESGDAAIGSWQYSAPSTGTGKLVWNDRINLTYTDVFTIEAGNIGIGTTSPSTVLDIRGCNTDNAVTVRNFCGDSYSAIGYVNCQGTLKAAVGIGNNSASAPFANNAYVYTPASTDFLFYIAGSERMRVRCDGNIGIATTSPSYKLHVNGTFYAAGSSIKYKEGICNYNTDSCLFMCLKPVTYQYKDEWKHLGKELKSDIQIGLIAEDVAEVMPELAVLINEEDEKVVRNVDYEKLSIVLLAEVQKLRREVDTLKNN